MACAYEKNLVFHIKKYMVYLIFHKEFTHTIHVNSRGIFDTITILYNGREHRLKQIVQQIFDRFEAKDTDFIRWVQIMANIADTLANCSA